MGGWGEDAWCAVLESLGFPEFRLKRLGRVEHHSQTSPFKVLPGVFLKNDLRR